VVIVILVEFKVCLFDLDKVVSQQTFRCQFPKKIFVSRWLYAFYDLTCYFFWLNFWRAAVSRLLLTGSLIKCYDRVFNACAPVSDLLFDMIVIAPVLAVAFCTTSQLINIIFYSILSFVSFNIRSRCILPMMRPCTSSVTTLLSCQLYSNIMSTTKLLLVGSTASHSDGIF
jgi:hypothetical protein